MDSVPQHWLWSVHGPSRECEYSQVSMFGNGLCLMFDSKDSYNRFDLHPCIHSLMAKVNLMFDNGPTFHV